MLHLVCSREWEHGMAAVSVIEFGHVGPCYSGSVNMNKRFRDGTVGGDRGDNAFGDDEGEAGWIEAA